MTEGGEAEVHSTRDERDDRKRERNIVTEGGEAEVHSTREREMTARERGTCQVASSK